MLKIKDNVDLKELEKYGYKENQNKYEKLVSSDNNSKVWTWYETIEIDKKDRIITTRLYNDCADQDWYGYIENVDRYLQDLEKADLVEKVEE